MNIPTEVMDEFNVMLQQKIAEAEHDGRPDTALAFAQIKFTVNQQFDQQRRSAGRENTGHSLVSTLRRSR